MRVGGQVEVIFHQGVGVGRAKVYGRRVIIQGANSQVIVRHRKKRAHYVQHRNRMIVEYCRISLKWYKPSLWLRKGRIYKRERSWQE